MITPKQIETLKYLIVKSNDGNDLLKKILLFLISRSEGLTKDVFLTLKEGGVVTPNMLVETSRNLMTSDGGTTHLDELMTLMGSKLLFLLHFGHYVNGKFDSGGSSMIYTFMLSREKNMRIGDCEQIFVSFDELNVVELVIH